MSDFDSLIAAATDARDRAIAPYSGFRVGAALETADRRVITGCNIENATFGLTVCAERVALLTALSAGDRQFRTIAVVTQSSKPVTPCGPCRQLLWEYCGDIDVVTASTSGVTTRYRLSELLPHPFAHIPED
jgi:cytidine deaminase